MSFVGWWLGGNRTHAEHERFKVAQGRPRPLVAGQGFADSGGFFKSGNQPRVNAFRHDGKQVTASVVAHPLKVNFLLLWGELVCQVFDGVFHCLLLVGG
jgi:hypothetical protein